MAVLSRIKHAWNAFLNQDPGQRFASAGPAANFGSRPDRVRLGWSNERSIIASIFTRLSIDVASIDVRHVRLDENKRYLEDIESGLNNCLTVEANLDQAARQFRQDIALTLFSKGVAAVVPIDTTVDPATSGGFDIKTLRVGEVIGWMPHHVRLRLYRESTGTREEITLEKKFVAIVENPLFAVMNEPNSTLQRIIHKLNLLDVVDDQSSSGKLDIIIQLPYVIKSEARRQQADQRRKDIEFQLSGSKYGVAYTDGTEKITQLNRPAENNLLKQVEYLMKMLYAQLGLTEEVMNGTADEAAMLNYNNRTVEPIVSAIVEAMRRSFLTKTARSQRQWILAFRDPFKLVPLADVAEIADKFTRNEIASSNDIRQAIGWKPSRDPKADQLVNSNMPQPTDVPATVPVDAGADEVVQSALDTLDQSLTDIFATLGVDENAVA